MRLVVVVAGIAAAATLTAARAQPGAVAGVPDPARIQAPTARQLKTYHAAFAAADRGKWCRARALVAGGDPLVGKILRWMYFTARGSGARFADITTFMAANPQWPGRFSLLRRAEETMAKSLPPDQVIDWFDRHPPLTTDGGILLGKALIKAGRSLEGTSVLRTTWIGRDFGRRQERTFLRRHRKRLRAEDHLERLDRLLWDRKFRQARRMLGRVDAGERAVARARLRLHRFRGGVDWTIRQVPKHLLDHPGLLYERVRWRRRKGRIEGALEILLKPPADLVRPDRWWFERAVIARRLIADGRVEEAYRIVRDHRLSRRALLAEAEWLAGWIALRFLNRRREALAHFERMYGAVRYPISLARGSYWAGRAAEAADDRMLADGWYARAAAHETTFYGQLAVERTKRRPMPSAPAEPTADSFEQERFKRHELARVAILLDRLGRDRLVKRFIDGLARASRRPLHQLLTGRLADEIGRRGLAVRVARRAARHGIRLSALAYPVIAMPNGVPERGLLLALARQESNMDPKARSRAGALGLMQLMPYTARHVARALKLRYSRARLTRDPDYNIKLGTAYLRSMLKKYDGSYVLSIAAYNAGPKAVDRWIGTHGDPRAYHVDAVDWVEMIPYGETRNYVQRVMENLQVYRRRLGQTRLARSMTIDLGR